jgi:hypothetical protein
MRPPRVRTDKSCPLLRAASPSALPRSQSLSRSIFKTRPQEFWPIDSVNFPGRAALSRRRELVSIPRPHNCTRRRGVSIVGLCTARGARAALRRGVFKWVHGEARPSCGRSFGGRTNPAPRSLPVGGKVRRCQRRGRRVSSFQQPCLQFRCRGQRAKPLVADGAKNIVDKIARIRADAFAHLFPEEVFHVFGQRNVHIVQVGDTSV